MDSGVSKELNLNVHTDLFLFSLLSIHDSVILLEAVSV